MTNASIPITLNPRRRKLLPQACIIHIGTNPPIAVKESCMEFTEPFEAEVVPWPTVGVGNAETEFLPFHVAAGLWSRLPSGRRLNASIPGCRAVLPRQQWKASPQKSSVIAVNNCPAPVSCPWPFCRKCSRVMPVLKELPASPGS